MFEIVGSDILALSDADLRTLVARLSIAELHRQELPVSGVTAGGNQDAPDGGLDVRVEAPDLPAPDFLPRKTTGFQVKKPDMPASAIGDEMKPSGMLRPVIGELADVGGAYIVFSAQGSVADGPLAARRKAMRDAVADHPKAGSLYVDFYDRERMATWANQYPGVAAWVRARTGSELAGWRPVGDWSDGNVENGSPYLENDHACLIDERSNKRERLPIADGIARLREALLQPRQAVRLIGLSGLGKTRLVQALFETGVGKKPLDPALAVYTDYSEQTIPTAREMARRLVDTNQRAILVVDNCNPATHSDLVSICAGNTGRVSLITVEYDVSDDEPERTNVFRLEHTSPALVEEWLKQNFDYVSQVDRGRIATFSDGNFRVARALAGTLQRGETLGQLKDRQLFERIVQQRNLPDQQMMLAAEDLSLLYSFDGENTSNEGELALIGAIRGVTPSQLYAHVAELTRRGIVQSRGRWRAILPHAIANPLASYALRRIPPADFDHFCARLPDRMLKSTSRRLGFLHDDPAASAAVARWLRPAGPLGNLFAIGEIGLDVVRNIAPVAPEAVLAKINIELLGPSGALIVSAKNTQRGRWISLIKALAYDAALFEDAAFALARFIAAEPEDYNHNSATGYFGELFKLYLSGTQATSAARRDVIRHMAASEDADIKSSAVLALDSMLETSHFSSMSNHDFGARPRNFGWQPQTFGEIWDWYDAGVALAVELNQTLPPVRKVLADNVRGIWQHVRSQDALDAASIEMTRHGPWIDGWIGFRQALTFDGGHMPDVVRERLVGIVERLKPNDLLNKARAVVLARSAGGFVDLGSVDSSPLDSWHLADQQAVDLGKAFANEPEMLAIFLLKLYAERTPYRAFHFGEGLAQGAADLARLWSTLLETFKGLPADARNATTLGGYLQGASASPAFVAAALDRVANDAEVARDLTYLQARAGIDRAGIARLSAALDAGKVDAGAFRQIATGVVGTSPGDALAPLLAKLVAHPGGAAIALSILHMAFFCAKSESREYDPDLIACGRGILADASLEDSTPFSDYGAGEVVEVCLTGADGAEAARTLCGRVREGLVTYVLSAYKITHLLNALFAAQPDIALSTFLLGDCDSHLDLQLERHSPLIHMDSGVLSGWADVDPEKRYPLIGQLLSIFEVSGLDEAVRLSPRFLELLEQAPDRIAFLGSAHSRLVPSGWSGSLADVLEKRRAMLGPLAEHRDPTVRSWLENLDTWLPEHIKAERRREAESEGSFE